MWNYFTPTYLVYTGFILLYLTYVCYREGKQRLMKTLESYIWCWGLLLSLYLDHQVFLYVYLGFGCTRLFLLDSVNRILTSVSETIDDYLMSVWE